MKIPDWFKIAWWILLTVAVAVLFLLTSLSRIATEHVLAIDLILLALLIMLLLLPLLSEIKLFGLSFKRDVEELRNDLKSQILSLRAEVQNSVQVNPQFYIGVPPTDQQLTELEKRAKPLLKRETKERAGKLGQKLEPLLDVPERNKLLFSVRFELEKQLSRIANEKNLVPVFGQRDGTALRTAQWLLEEGIVDDNFFGLLRAIYGICSRAIHENITDKQASFVRDLSPAVLKKLRSI